MGDRPEASFDAAVEASSKFDGAVEASLAASGVA